MNRGKGENIHARVKVFVVLDTSSECALQMYEVSLKKHLHVTVIKL